MPTETTWVYPKPKDWDEFENIVWDLFRREWQDPDAQRYGRSGQEQHGIDVYGCPIEMSELFVGVQCKRYEDEKLTEKIIRGEISKVEKGVKDGILPFKPAKFIIATTASRDVKLQDAIVRINEKRESIGGFTTSLIFWEDLSDMLANSKNEDLLRKHYPTISRTHQKAEVSYIAQADRGGVAQIITNIFRGGIDEARELRNRQNMLQLVWNTWVEGVLKQSLHNEVLIELGMETKPDAIDHPWDMVMQMPEQKPEVLPLGVKMLDILNQTNGAMLILGEPGSGKTTMLLQLAREAVEHAREDPIQPIPVVFNLSSWTPTHSIAEWLVAELQDKYYVSKKISRLWLDTNELMLLLDGLDEVKVENREQCVQAINAYRTEHNPYLVICCRRHEFEALTTSLKLYGAVLIQPLTDQQIEDYLQKFRPELAPLHRAYDQDLDLREFIRTPFILSVIMRAYQNATEADMGLVSSVGDYRKLLFDVYIDKTFSHRSIERRYAPMQTKMWLGWLANRMEMNSLSIFYIEHMQPTWLIAPDQQRNFRIVSSILGGGIIGIVVGLLFSIFWMMVFKNIGIRAIEFAPLLGPLFGLVAGAIFFFSPGIHTTESIGISVKSIGRGLVLGLIILMFCFVYFAIPQQRDGLDFTLLYEALRLSLFCSLIPGLVVALIFGIEVKEIKTKTKPNQGIWQSLQNSIFICLVVGIIVGLGGGLILSYVVGRRWAVLWQPVSMPLMGWLTYGLSIGLAIAVIASTRYGVAAYIKHFYLRWILYKSGYIPWNFVRFLDYANDRILLRKVGGGYIFIHRMLMEHFAEMEFGQSDQPI